MGDFNDSPFYEYKDALILLIVTASVVVFNIGDMMYKIWVHQFLTQKKFQPYCNWHFWMFVVTQGQFAIIAFMVFGYFETSVFLYSCGIIFSIPFVCLSAHFYMGEKINMEQIIAICTLLIATFFLAWYEHPANDFPDHNPAQKLSLDFQTSTQPWVFSLFMVVIIVTGYQLMKIRYNRLQAVNADLLADTTKANEIHAHFNHNLPNDTRFSKTRALLTSSMLIGANRFWKAVFGEAFAVYLGNFFFRGEDLQLMQMGFFFALWLAECIFCLYIRAYIFSTFEANQIIPLQKVFILIFNGTGKICFFMHTPNHPTRYLLALLLVFSCSIFYAYFSIDPIKQQNMPNQIPSNYYANRGEFMDSVQFNPVQKNGFLKLTPQQYNEIDHPLTRTRVGQCGGI